ncbi:hypothetical protein [Peribacillus sp. NPDC096540]|uniref:hypothetical protein n=1 Tax=Peribacillus sp. NPDC096540 TaxID=3390612 RepID=UPI003CFE5D78
MVTSKLFELASLPGEPSAAMLTNLMNGRFHTAMNLLIGVLLNSKRQMEEVQ